MIIVKAYKCSYCDKVMLNEIKILKHEYSCIKKLQYEAKRLKYEKQKRIS